LPLTLDMTSPVRGIDRVAMTVPNLDDASRFLEEALRRWTPPAMESGGQSQAGRVRQVGRPLRLSR
jgi:hypothetical protein